MFARLFSAITLAGFTAYGAPNPAALVKVISAVGSEGAGNEAASKAWRELTARDGKALLPILEGMAAGNELAANWLRSAVESIANRELAAGRALPLAALEKFVLRKENAHSARRLAFELITKVDPARSEKLLAGMLDDPGLELRREAVARELQNAGMMQAQGKAAEAKTAFQKLLPKARDVDQVDTIVKALRKMGETVEVAEAFGFLTEWRVIGPFDSAGGKGFAAVYPPEKEINFNAEYDGKFGPVKWREFASKHDYGDVSMNLPYTHLKGAAAYAHTEFYMAKAGPVELRLGSQNAFKVWLNGEYLFGIEEYHRNKVIDQYPMRAQLKAGKNTILVKVCQNEQTEDWADAWDFQIRVCDPLGAAIASAAPGASGKGAAN